VAVIFPVGTVTDAGGIADLVLLDSLTTYPGGAGEPMVIVPFVETVPVTVVGDNEMDVKAGGV
jgi:hypothetical protein